MKTKNAKKSLAAKFVASDPRKLAVFWQSESFRVWLKLAGVTSESEPAHAQ